MGSFFFVFSLPNARQRRELYSVSFPGLFVWRDIVLVFELRETFLTRGFLSQLSLSKPPTEIFSCVFFDALVSDEQQHGCVCLCV